MSLSGMEGRDTFQKKTIYIHITDRCPTKKGKKCSFLFTVKVYHNACSNDGVRTEITVNIAREKLFN